MTAPRPAVPADLPAIAAVHRAAWTRMVRGHDPAFPVAGDLRAWEGRWRKAFADPWPPREGLAVIEDAGAVVAAAWLGPFKNAGPDLAHRALLRRVYVHPDNQGRGHGSRLLAWAEARAREGGARRLELWCLDVNAAAVAFYRRRGYEPDGATGAYRRDGPELAKRRYRKLLP